MVRFDSLRRTLNNMKFLQSSYQIQILTSLSVYPARSLKTSHAYIHIIAVVPQNLPSHILQEMAKSSCKIPQGLHSAKVSYTVKTRVCVLIKKVKFSKVQSSLTCLEILSSILISSFKTFSTKLHSQKP